MVISPDLEPCILVIFGATGDLTQRKLYPALANLATKGFLPDRFAVVAVGRRSKTDSIVREEARHAAGFSANTVDIKARDRFLKRLHYFQMDFDNREAYQGLRAFLAQLDDAYQTQGNRIFFLAVAPQYFGTIAKDLHFHGMATNVGAWQRVVVEKPFGNDLTSARQLNTQLTKTFGEQRVYRIDHYLGKEMLQNLMVVSFANTLFEPLWNSRYIEEVQITVSETGVGSGSVLEAAVHCGYGTNHMLQLLTLLTNEHPVALDADSVGMKSEGSPILRPLTKAAVTEQVVRGHMGLAPSW